MLKVKGKNRISSDYRFTTDDRNHPEVLTLKKLAKANNKNVREQRRDGATWPHLRLQRVKLRGRGSRVEHETYKNQYTQELPLDLATQFDVYYSEDTHAEWILLEELKAARA